MVSVMEEKKLIAKAEVTDLATPEEKAAIVRILEKAGLNVYVNRNTLFIRAPKDDRTCHLPTY